MQQRPRLGRPSLARLVALASLVGLPLLVGGATGCAAEGELDDDGTDEPTGEAESPLVKTVAFQNGASGYAGATDATLTQATPTTNAGEDPVLRADVDYPNGSGKVANVVLRFDLSSIAKGSKVEGVTLGVHVLNATSGQGYTLYALARGFAEGQATWNAAASGAAWAAGGARGATDRGAEPLGTLLPTATGAYAVTLNAAGLAAVQRWVDDPSKNFGFVLDATTNQDGLEIASSESPTAANRPKLSVKVSTPDAGTGLEGAYYAGTAFQRLVTTRTDATIDFAWGTAAPATGVPADGYSVRWSGQVLPAYSQTYTFSTRSDDGVRVWVDGKKIIDNWTNHAETENAGTVALTAGKKANLVVEYYENTGGAVAKLSWASSSQPKQIVPKAQLFPPATTAPPPPPPPPTGAFVHPGIGVGRGQLDFVKAKIAAGAQPWAGELERAKNSRVGKLTWVARPVATIRCGNGPSDVDEGCTTSRDDAAAAYTLALIGYHTGDARYSAAAAAILDAWATTLKEIVFVYGNYDTHNGPLQAAWLAESFPRSAEILRATYSGWPAANAARFGTMLKTAILPRIVDGWNDGGHNWSTSMANGTMNIGVYTDDRAIFDKGVAAWRLRTPQNFHLKSDGPKPIVPREYAQGDGTWKPDALASAWFGQTEFGTDRTNGITKETCRDFGHVEMTLASVAYGAETGLLQGLDLYGEMRERIVRAYEFVAKWHNLAPANFGKARDYATPSWLCPAQGHVQLQELPTWEVGYNHLATRLGVSMPETRALVDRYRASSAGRYTNLQIQWETLTHGGIGWGGLR